MTNYFETLGLEPNSSETSVRNAYRKIVLDNHPDNMDLDTPDKKNNARNKRNAAIEAFEAITQNNSEPDSKKAKIDPKTKVANQTAEIANKCQCSYCN